MEQNSGTYNEYDTTVDMVGKYILANTIQVTMAETRFYKNLSNTKKKADEQGFGNLRESMALKSARFRIYNGDSGAVYSHAEKVRKAEEIKTALETMKRNSATNTELNNRFKEWKENNANYNEIMFAIGESQIERLHELGLSLDKLTSQKEGFEHVKAVLENAVQEGKIASGQVMSYKLGTWRYLSAPNIRSIIGQKQNDAKSGQSPLPSTEAQKKTPVTPDESISPKTPEALLAAKVVLDEIIQRCGYPAGTQVQSAKILPLLNLAEAKGFITKEERPAFEKALQPLIDAAP
jgi:DNA-binding PadR family transcriptional regulator